MAHVNCKVKSITPLTDVVFEVVLTPEVSVDFRPGQYLQVVMTEEDQRPFSIANPAQQNDILVLHIGATPENPYAWEVLEKMRNDEQITVNVPDGNAFFQTTERPTLLIAGGTGFSYVNSILYSVLHNAPNQSITLYWGVRNEADLYHKAELESLANKHSNFTFKPVVENADSDWSGLTGRVHEAAMDNEPQLADYDVYVAGRFEMAKVIRDDFTAKGCDAKHIFGDAFAYL